MKNQIQEINKRIALVRDPYTEKDLLNSNAIREMKLKNGKLRLLVCLHYPSDFVSKQIESELKQRLAGLDFIKAIKITVQSVIKAKQTKNNSVKNIKNIIAVASGKGGVGKSTVAANLAVTLSEAGAKVGLLDADIYGPSQAQLFSIQHHGKPAVKDNKYFLPVNVLGVEMMSMALISPEDAPLIWRGPMVSSVLQQMLFNTVWDVLDYLIVDLPPGTGDIHLTLIQKIPLTAAVIVTTPQDVALLDVQKTIQMFNKLKVPLIGVIENMSYHECEACHHKSFIFGQGGGKKLKEQFNLNSLGSLPLSPIVQRSGEFGKPIASTLSLETTGGYKALTEVEESRRVFVANYRDIAIKTALGLAELPDAKAQIIDVMYEA